MLCMRRQDTFLLCSRACDSFDYCCWPIINRFTDFFYVCFFYSVGFVNKNIGFDNINGY